MKFQAPRGTEDVLPGDSAQWVHLEETFRSVARLYGYQEIRTPTFEDTALFHRSSGETSDIVSKQMYTFEDKGGRSLTLKPEETAPALRAVIEHNLCPVGTQLRLNYVTSIYRYERPQKGRLREAHQFGLELLGVQSVAADFEIIDASVRFYKAIGIDQTCVLINSLGRDEARGKYREALLEFAQPYLVDLDLESRAKVEMNPLRVLDSKDPKAIEFMKEAPSILDFLEDDSVQRFKDLQVLLDMHDIAYKIRPDIVRGLDYYTETVFEIQSEHLGSQGALCGGGRYDGLIAALGGSDTPAVGVGMGIERALLVLEAVEKLKAAENVQVAIICVEASLIPGCTELASQLRDHGISVLMEYDAKSMKSQMRMADRAGAQFTLFYGPDELKEGKFKVKNMVTKEQIESAPEHLPVILGGKSTQP